MNEEAKKDLLKMSREELLSLYKKIVELKNDARNSIVEVREEDLKPKRKRRGSKN